MSNDRSYDLTFRAPEKKTLEEIQCFLQQKQQRWELRGNKTSKQLVEELGLQHPAEVVTWGFEFGKILKGEDGSHSVHVSSWANENSSNIPIGGEEGELFYLLRDFPELSISGEFTDDYGVGDVAGWCCEYREEEEKDHLRRGDNDTSAVAIAVKHDDDFASKRLQGKRKIASKAVESCGTAIRTTSGGLKKAKTLTLRLITAETQDALYHESLDYLQTWEPSQPGNRKYVLAYYNDAPDEAGELSRSLAWFDGEKELLEFIPGSLLVLNAGGRECEILSRDLAVVVTAYWNTEISRDDAIGRINDLATDFFHVEWWGSREDLLNGDEAFPKWLRSGWRQSEDASPLKDSEFENFYEYLWLSYGLE